MESLVPWEFIVYRTLLNTWIKEENERIEKENAKRG